MIEYQSIAVAPSTRVQLGDTASDRIDVHTKNVGQVPGNGFNINESIARLLRFYYLNDDWDDDGSPAPSDETICLAMSLLMDSKFLLESSSVFPSFEGGILIEWRKRGWGYSLLLLNNGHIVFFGVEIAGNEELDEMTVLRDDIDSLMKNITTLLSE